MKCFPRNKFFVFCLARKTLFDSVVHLLFTLASFFLNVVEVVSELNMQSEI